MMFLLIRKQYLLLAHDDWGLMQLGGIEFPFHTSNHRIYPFAIPVNFDTQDIYIKDDVKLFSNNFTTMTLTKTKTSSHAH